MASAISNEGNNTQAINTTAGMPIMAVLPSKNDCITGQA